MKNFIAMPWLLKLMTISAFSVLGFVVGSVVTTSPIMVFGQPVTVSEWWSSGAGILTVTIAIIGGAAGVLMLRRSRFGRSAYILTWAVASASIPLIAALTGKGIAGSLPAAIFDLAVTVAIAIYLHKNQAIQSYFGANQVRRG